MFIIESPYYLFYKNRIEECEKVLYKISKKNGYDYLPDIKPLTDEPTDDETIVSQTLKTTYNCGLFFSINVMGLLWTSVTLIFY